jgi:hypothetical protein
MKVAFLILSSLFLFEPGSVSAQLLTTGEPASIFATYPHLEAQAKEYVGSFVRKDFARFLELTWPAYVARHGRQMLLTEVAQTANDLETYGALLAWTPNPATQLIEESGSLYAVVPTVMKVRASDQVVEMPVCLIAISTDRGVHWTFVSSTCVKVKDAFPQVAQKWFCVRRNDGR